MKFNMRSLSAKFSKKMLVLSTFLGFLFIAVLVSFTYALGIDDGDEFLADIETKNVEVLEKSGYELENLNLKSSPSLFKVKRKNVSSLDAFLNETLSLKIKNKRERKKYQVSTNDTFYGNQWNVPKIKADQAWAAGATGSSGVTVAVLDTGMGVGLSASTPIHEEFTGRIWANSVEAATEIDGLDNDGNGKIDDRYGWDFVSGDLNPAPDDGGSADGDFAHGTLVAGVIAATANNSKGIAGIDWAAKIMPLRVMDNSGDGWTDDIAQAIEYAADNGAKVINMSFGYAYSLGPDSVLENAINYAYNRGVVLVAAAGNDNAGVNYPAASANVIAVGATDSNDNRASFSSYGSQLDIMAPGVTIPTTTITWSSGTYTTNQYASAGGTSLSSPQVAALTSLLFSKNPSASPGSIEAMIINNIDKVAGMGGQNRTNYYGYGRINNYDSIFSYDYQFISSVNPPSSMAASNTVFVQVHIRNTGGATWYNEAEYNADSSNKRPMRLAVINADGQNFWPNNDTWVDNVRIAMTSGSVASGQIGSFNFTVKAPLTPGTHTLRFMPVVEGVQALSDIGMQFTTTISYDYNIISAVNPPSSMAAGSTAFVQVHLRNTGGSTWYNEGNSYPMRLAVINADGQNFWPNNDTWVDNVRIAMTSGSVASGQIGSFNFTVKAPLTPGTHTLRFMPVVEGVQALQDIGMQFVVNISYNYSYLSSANPPATMSPGSTAFVQVHLRNTGGSTWYNEGNSYPMRLAVINADGQNFWPNNDTWVDNVRIAMTSGSVASGQIGSFNFTVKAPLTPGTHTLRFMPVVEGVQALRDIGMQFVVVVQ